MRSGNFVAYYRVSTDRQSRSGLGLEAQRQAVAGYLNGGGWKLIGEFVETESGRRADRPELTKAIRESRRARATLIIAKLDRLARNVAFISNLMESGVEFVAADMPMANRLTIHILAAVAEHEREMISERTKAALAAAKARGVLLGNRTNIQAAQMISRRARSAAARRFAVNALPAVNEIRASGIISLSGIAKALTARGVPAPRGGPWQAVQVKRVLDHTKVQFTGVKDERVRA